MSTILVLLSLSLGGGASALSRSEMCYELFAGLETLPGASFLVRDFSQEIKSVEGNAAPSLFIPRNRFSIYPKPYARIKANVLERIDVFRRVLKSVGPGEVRLQKELTVELAKSYAAQGIAVRIYRWRGDADDHGYRLQILPQAGEDWAVKAATYLHHQAEPIGLNVDVGVVGSGRFRNQYAPIWEAGLHDDNWELAQQSHIFLQEEPTDKNRLILEHEMYHSALHLERQAGRSGIDVWPTHQHVVRPSLRESAPGWYLKKGQYPIEEIGAQLHSAMALLAEIKLHTANPFYPHDIAKKEALEYAKEAFVLAEFALWEYHDATRGNKVLTTLSQEEIRLGQEWVESYAEFIKRNF